MSAAFGQVDPLGSSNPAKYKLADLPSELVAVELATGKDSFQSLMMMSMSSMDIRGTGETVPKISSEVMFEMMNMVWMSKDQALGNSEFMVGYKLDLPMAKVRTAGKDDLVFRITYIRRSTIISITPREDYLPSALRELAKGPTAPVGTVPQRTATLSNIKQISTAMVIYLADSDDIFPYVQGTPQLFKLLMPYCKNEEIMKTLNPAGGMFRFNMSLAGVNSTEIAEPANTVMFYESEPWADGSRCVSFADTHAKVVNPEEWAKLQPSLNLKLKRVGKPSPPRVAR